MSVEEIDTLKLIYAKEYYSQEDFASGNALVKSVERSKNKTKEIQGFLRQ